MRLNGENIYLREVRLTDLNQRYVDWLNDPEVNRYLETRFQVQSLESITDYFDNHVCKADEPWWAILSREKKIMEASVYTGKIPYMPYEMIKNEIIEEKHIGNIKLGPIDWRHRRADISLFIGDKSQWGKGHGTEAIKLVRDYAFNILNLNKVCAGIYISNKVSRRAFEKAGFVEEGLLINHVWNKGYEDLGLMGRIRFDS